MEKIKSSCIAIIPARGGSKRLPRKNILPVNGQPMISYPIQAAIESGCFEKVVVSTEDEEIANIAESYGALIMDRDAGLALDNSTVVQVCEDVLSREEFEGIDKFCCIYATAIFVTAEDINSSYQLLTDSPLVDYVMSVSEYNIEPVQALKSVDGYLESMWPEYNSMQSQLYPHLVASNGTLYWARKNEFISDKTFYGKRLKGYVIPQDHVVDIDTQGDYEKAQKLALEL